ncbi:hypothetical protein ACKLNR_005751 [Fusarium oxysporum f. sp. zingiberi]
MDPPSPSNRHHTLVNRCLPPSTSHISLALSLTLLFLVLSFPRFCSLFAVPPSKSVDIYLAPVLYIVIPQDSCSFRELKKRDTPQSTSGSIISPFRSFSSADPRYYDPGAFQHCLNSTYLPNTFVPGE